MEGFALIPNDSQSLRRYFDNPDFVDAISTMGNPEPMVLWLKAPLLKFDQLNSKLQGRLEASIRGAQRERIDNYLMMVEEAPG